MQCAHYSVILSHVLQMMQYWKNKNAYYLPHFSRIVSVKSVNDLVQQ